MLIQGNTFDFIERREACNTLADRIPFILQSGSLHLIGSNGPLEGLSA